MPDVSVIIPVFKVEKFIGRCARSLMEQTLQDVEFVFVDDGSPDGSMAVLDAVLAEYPQRSEQVRIVTHEVNKGLPAARNTGLAVASGEYVFHCDSDDFVEPDMLEKMFSSAKAADADMAYCDFFLTFEQNERYMHNPDYTTGDEALRKGFLAGAMKYNVWNKIVRREIYTAHGIQFPEGHAMGEDMTMMQVAAYCRNVCHVEKALYHYVKLNSNAYSNTMSPKHLEDIRFNLDRTVAFLRDGFGDAYDDDIALFKLNTKLPFLISDEKSSYNIWKEWYPEANGMVMNNPNLPLRTRCLQWMASKNLWGGVWLYNKLVYKFIYGIIFK